MHCICILHLFFAAALAINAIAALQKGEGLGGYNKLEKCRTLMLQQILDL